MKYSKLMKERIRRVRVLFKELGYELFETDKDEDTYAAAFEGSEGFQGGFFIDSESKFLEIAFTFVFSDKLGTYIQNKLEEIGQVMGAAHVWRAPLSGGAPGPHTQGGTRMGSDPQSSVVNKYSQSWDIPNLFVVGSSTNPSQSGFNPTLTIQAVAYMCADAIVGRYRKSPGPLV